ncbi:MAG: hypothetical protein ACOYD6_01880 [Limnochordia bacterium]|jgi:hypothetical protein
MKVLLLLCILLSLPTPAQGMQVRWQTTDYTMEAILQVVAGDLTGDGQDELVLLGRNYERREVFIDILTWNGREFTRLWRSNNLYVPTSHVIMGLGRFTGEDLQLVVIDRTKSVIFGVQGERLIPIWQGAPPGEPHLMGVLDERYLVLSQVAELKLDTVVEKLAVYAWDDGWHLKGESGSIGRIRALAPGKGQIAVEVGLGTKAGEVQIWDWQPRWRLAGKTTVSNTAAFALTYWRDCWVVADDRGIAAAYDFSSQPPRLQGRSSGLGWALVDATAINLPTGQMLIVAGYPNRLYLLGGY